jgi:hypothetical protein
VITVPLDHATAWVDDVLAAAGTARTGPLDVVHERPWAVVARVPTVTGLLWFKAQLPSLAHEGPLLALLGRLRPGVAVELVARDVDTGWLLTRDAGGRLRDLVTAANELPRWYPVLAGYAELQRSAAGHVPELLALGLPDQRGARLADQVADLLDDDTAVLAGHPDGLTDDERRALRGLLPALAERAAVATALGPDTVEHDDLHDGNVFVREGQARLGDWGDARVAPAFASLVVLTRMVVHLQQVDRNGPEVGALWRAYLEPWTTAASMPQLLDAARAAYPVGLLLRGLSWHGIARQLPIEERAEYADGLPHYLRDVLAELSG